MTPVSFVARALMLVAVLLSAYPFPVRAAAPAVSLPTVLAVPAPSASAVAVRPDRADWLYASGEKAEFHITGPAGAQVRYRVGPEQYEGPFIDATLPVDGLRVPVQPPAAPGFVRCEVTVAALPPGAAAADGKPGPILATIGYAPERIVPTQAEPADFDDFWRRQKAQLDAVPPDYRLTPAPQLSNDKVEVYYLRYQMSANPRGASYFHGVLSVPRGQGPYPAVLYVPGAGVRPYKGQVGMAARGVITLQMGIHGIGLDYPASLYEELGRGVLNEYNRFNLDNREAYYYRRVYLGAMRALDYLVGHRQWNRRDLIVTGGSQGGQLSIMLAGVDRRVTGVAAAFPAYSDVTGYLHGRAGGWPGLFRPRPEGGRSDEPVEPKRITTGYYDTVNFARRVRVPGHYSTGFNDTVTPPTSVFAAFNSISAPKEVVLAPDQGHETSPAQRELMERWILKQVGLAR